MGMLDSLLDWTVPGGSKGVGSFLHPERGYQAAEKTAQQYYRDAQGNLQPVMQQGQEQYGRLNQQAQMLNDPVALENQWAQSYQTSPYAQQAMNQARETGMNEASSMGLMGSSAALQNVQQNAANIMQQDRKQYLDDLMQKYMQSIGIGQNIYGTGANAAGALSGNAMTQGQNMAGLAYGAQNAPGEMLGKILGGLGQAGINYATGGVSGAASGMAR